MYGISFFILTFVPNMQTNIFFTTINTKTNMKALLAIAVASLFCMSAYANPGDGDGDKNDLTKENVQPTLADYFSPVSKNVAKPDVKGFIRRWLLLEPIDKPNRSNTVFTDTYIRENFSQQYFPGQFTDIPGLEGNMQHVFRHHGSAAGAASIVGNGAEACGGAWIRPVGIVQLAVERGDSGHKNTFL